MQKSLSSHIRHYRHDNILAYRYGNDCDGNDVLMFGALPGTLCVSTRYDGYVLWRRVRTYVNNSPHFLKSCTKYLVYMMFGNDSE